MGVFVACRSLSLSVFPFLYSFLSDLSLSFQQQPGRGYAQQIFFQARLRTNVHLSQKKEEDGFRVFIGPSFWVGRVGVSSVLFWAMLVDEVISY